MPYIEQRMVGTGMLSVEDCRNPETQNTNLPNLHLQVTTYSCLPTENYERDTPRNRLQARVDQIFILG